MGAVDFNKLCGGNVQYSQCIFSSDVDWSYWSCYGNPGKKYSDPPEINDQLRAIGDLRRHVPAFIRQGS